MGDRQLREQYADLPPLDFPSPAFFRPPPLSQSRVALVTTAALRSDGQARWLESEVGFTELPATVGEDLRVTHRSSNFDRSGFAADYNVIFPIDRLHELAADGVIGSVAERHISFLGAQREAGLEAIRLDSGPAAAEVLHRDQVDVVLLTPV